MATVGLDEGTRLIIEKPLGGLGSAVDLNATLHAHFPESAIFRIDHFIGKEPRGACSSPGSPTPSPSRSGTAHGVQR